MDENRWMRRGLVMVGIWMVAVVVAVAVAFAAVNRVASGVAPHDSARLSKSAIDDALSTPSTTRTATTRRQTPTTRPSPTTATTATPSTGSTPTTTGTSPTTPSNPTTWSPPPTSPPATVTTTEAPPTTAEGQRNTATTSQGGTVFTRCSAPDSIVYVAAVPRSGYQRTVDVESPLGIQQSFQSANHVSRIELECSDGTVHAQVEEEAADN